MTDKIEEKLYLVFFHLFPTAAIVPVSTDPHRADRYLMTAEEVFERLSGKDHAKYRVYEATPRRLEHKWSLV